MHTRLPNPCLVLLITVAIILRTHCWPEITSSHIHVLPGGTSFQPAHPIELLGSFTAESFLHCATECTTNPQCRTFVFDSSTDQCNLYEGETSTGTLITNASSTSQVASIEYIPELYRCYNQSSLTCPFNRYLVADILSGRGVCPRNTYWDGNMCLNQLYYGETCTHEQSCRSDLYLGCSNITGWTCGGAFGMNLIRNGDAETGPCATDDNITHPTFWSYSGSVTQTDYSLPDASLTTSSPGPSDAGRCYFSGFSDFYTFMHQTVNLTLYAFQIDANRVTYNYSAWIGGWAGQDDHVSTWLDFRNAAGVTLMNATIAPVLAIDRMNITQLLYREILGSIPVNTRSVTVFVSMTSNTFWNDGSIDNISFQLSYFP